MIYRNEVKHEINAGDKTAIIANLRAAASPDPHVGKDGRYLIRSLYFDNLYDKALREKIDGVNEREKFRIRYYNGDTSFIPWTGAYISGLSTDEYYEEMKAHGKDVKPLDKDAMLEYVQKSGGKVIAKKGATFYAVSATVCQLVGLILAASDSLATVSSMLHGEYGIEDVCLSTLTLVGPNGIQGKVQMRMNKEEVALLKKSADALKEVIAQIEL